MQRKISPDKIVKYIGRILSLTAVIYLGFYFYSLFTRNKSYVDISNLIIPILLFAIISMGCVSLNALTYYYILKDVFKTVPPFQDIWEIYVSANICKYLPSNVMHFVGRNILAERYNIPQKKMFHSTLYEILNTVLATSLFCGTLAVIHYGLYYLLLLFIPVIFLLKKYNALAPFLLVMLVTLINNTVVVILYNLYSGKGLICQFNQVSFYQSVSWLVGFLTPGAPAGIGIKEFVLIRISPGELVERLSVVVILQRVVLILGDAGAYLLVRIRELLQKKTITE